MTPSVVARSAFVVPPLFAVAATSNSASHATRDFLARRTSAANDAVITAKSMERVR